MVGRRDPKVTSRIMARVPSKDTKPEMLVRRRLWAAGLRYRVHVSGLPGSPDIVFSRARVAVFVDGDFWHGNAWKVRELASPEKLFPTNTDWWLEKIERNVHRDEHVTEALTADDWKVIRVWESEVVADPDGVAYRIGAIVRHRRAERDSER